MIRKGLNGGTRVYLGTGGTALNVQDPDPGNDVTSDRIVSHVKESGAGYLGLSALLTTTMREMGAIIQTLDKEGLRDQVRVLIGGAPTSEAFAKEIGADAYCRDAFHAIDILKQMAA